MNIIYIEKNHYREKLHLQISLLSTCGFNLYSRYLITPSY